MKEELQAVQARSSCIATEAEVAAALDSMALALKGASLDAPVVVLCVMNGGLMVCAELLKRLQMPLVVDYIHASRYRGELSGAGIEWRSLPTEKLAGKAVIVVDDIYDEGITLDAVVDYCVEQGAERVLSAVLVDKQHQRKASSRRPDVVGLQLADHYLYGMGMDYKGYLRNNPAIYALEQ